MFDAWGWKTLASALLQLPMSDVTGDLREATIYVSLFGSDKEKEDTLIALKHASGHVRTELGKVLKLRHIPTITFDKDTSLDYSMHIESLLNEIKKDEETN